VSNTAESTAKRPLRVAIVGAGPAGVYAADILTKSNEVKDGDFEVSIDLFEAYPAPYGLIRYGVAPDHPRIKGIVNALHKVLDRGDIRFLGNVTYGRDLTLHDFRAFYDAVIFSTGAIKDAALDIPGIELEGSFGAADFVSWYDGHPDVSREWPLDAKEIAVIGNGNVALDVARMLVKHADELLATEIPDNVYQGLKNSPVTDVHVFGRRGPAQVKFTPLELRELSHARDVDIVLYPEDFEFDEASDDAIRSNNQTKTMVNTMTNWLVEEHAEAEQPSSRRLHLHFLHSPVEIYDDGGSGKVAGIKFERMQLDGTGNVKGTGEFIDYPVQAVYRAIGYHGSALDELEYDAKRGVIPNEGGRVLDADGSPLAGANLDIWQADAEGRYSGFMPGPPEGNLRGQVRADADGRYEFTTVIPGPYTIPLDGPTGKLTAAAGWSPWRPAHIHLIVSAEGYEPLVTQLFIDTSDHLHDDVASAVKDELIVHPEPSADEPGRLQFEYDFALAPVRTPAVA